MRFAGRTIFVDNFIDERFLAVWADLAENHEANIPLIGISLKCEFLTEVLFGLSSGLSPLVLMNHRGRRHRGAMLDLDFLLGLHFSFP